MPRPPKPARLKLVEGRSPGRDSGGRKVPESPKFIRQAPDAPDWLDAEALAEWRRVAPTLERLDLLKPEDRALLSAYCETWSVYVAAVQRVRAEGLTITSPKSGVVHRNPAVTVDGAHASAALGLRVWPDPGRRAATGGGAGRRRRRAQPVCPGPVMTFCV